jgi:lipoprotein-anchoring transpeptidase ErfK/SrfK
MARRKTITQKLVTAAAIVAVLGIGVAIYTWPGEATQASDAPGPIAGAMPQGAVGKVQSKSDSKNESKNETKSEAASPLKPAPAKPGTSPMPLAAVEKTPPIVTVTPSTRPSALQNDKPAPAGAGRNNAPTAGAGSNGAPASAPAHIPKPQPVVTGDAAAVFAEVDAKRKADDLIAARDLLVAAIAQKKFAGVNEDEAMRRLSEINAVVVFSPRRFLSDAYAVSHVVAAGENLQKIANKYDSTPGLIARINGISDPRRLQAGKSVKVVKGPFHAVVNKKDFTLDTYLGKPGTPEAVFVRRFRVGLGSEDSTPTGEWSVGVKEVNPNYTNPREEGPRLIARDDPKNPLGERWIALSGTAGQAVGKTSYGIHGTIEPESIGQQRSLGCVRMLNEDVEVVYDMLITGKSTVTVSE